MRRALLKLRFLLIMPAAGAGKIYSGFIFAVVDTVFFTASLIESSAGEVTGLFLRSF